MRKRLRYSIISFPQSFVVGPVVHWTPSSLSYKIGMGSRVAVPVSQEEMFSDLLHHTSMGLDDTGPRVLREMLTKTLFHHSSAVLSDWGDLS